MGIQASTGRRAREDRVAAEIGATGAWVDGKDAEAKAKAKASLREDEELEVQCSWRCCDKRRKGAVCRACALRVSLQVPCVLGVLRATRRAGWLAVCFLISLCWPIIAAAHFAGPPSNLTYPALAVQLAPRVGATSSTSLLHPLHPSSFTQFICGFGLAWVDPANACKTRIVEYLQTLS